MPSVDKEKLEKIHEHCEEKDISNSYHGVKNKRPMKKQGNSLLLMAQLKRENFGILARLKDKQEEKDV